MPDAPRAPAPEIGPEPPASGSPSVPFLQPASQRAIATQTATRAISWAVRFMPIRESK